MDKCKKIGPYKIIDELGSGGMGIVYLGEAPNLKCKVAIKILRKDKTYTEFPKLAARFMYEARAAARLKDDPRIVKIHTIGKRKNGLPYIVMEHVEGTLLNEFIEKENPSISWRLDKFQDILEAIAYAHEKNVVHRDLKPGNIMIAKSNLDKTGLVKIMDFGLALTVLGQRMGSLSYSSPEQAAGKITDHRTDIYSLGVLLYWLLTGHLPFEASDTLELLKMICDVPAPSVQVFNHGISDELAAVVARCLEKEPDKRFQSVQKLLDEFKVCPKRQVDDIDIIVEEPTPEQAPDTYVSTVESSTNEHIIEKTRRVIRKAIENPYDGVIESSTSSSTLKITVGDRFNFGHYPQGPSGEVKPIVWRVLERDSDSLLVISEKALDAKSYLREGIGKRYIESSFEPDDDSLTFLRGFVLFEGMCVPWSGCFIRRWLNEEFLEKAFSDDEQSRIMVSAISNSIGPSTDDLIFLLSYDEATNLFANDDCRICKPTDYAVENGAPIRDDDSVYAGGTTWWLRSNSDYGFLSVLSGGVINREGLPANVVCSVRPTLRLAIYSKPKAMIGRKQE